MAANADAGRTPSETATNGAPAPAPPLAPIDAAAAPAGAAAAGHSGFGDDLVTGLAGGLREVASDDDREDVGRFRDHAGPAVDDARVAVGEPGGARPRLGRRIAVGIRHETEANGVLVDDRVEHGETRRAGRLAADVLAAGACTAAAG